MLPIVNGLQEMYGDRVAFEILDAADRAQGQAAFESLSLPGHPSYVIYSADKRETYRAFGVFTTEELAVEIDKVLDG